MRRTLACASPSATPSARTVRLGSARTACAPSMATIRQAAGRIQASLRAGLAVPLALHALQDVVADRLRLRVARCALRGARQVRELLRQERLKQPFDQAGAARTGGC